MAVSNITSQPRILILLFRSLGWSSFPESWMHASRSYRLRELTRLFMAKTVAVVIQEDPRKTHRPVEALRIALVLWQGLTAPPLSSSGKPFASLRTTLMTLLIWISWKSTFRPSNTSKSHLSFSRTLSDHVSASNFTFNMNPMNTYVRLSNQWTVPSSFNWASPL